ncbi:cell division protein ZapB [Candidatus Erwinia haradaeae]|uniref:Cell division protein ZapB n=1 Tax=Candidatus Erwinia haradaeae TaxID=1922217 RepID=A0A451DKK7_9GAMM|nr:cell division protein ZapB [Candidatus Erwinia haradaeae]VFP87257.1 Cell division protein ZapB [Candidatus Erwinia haradaeae]
MLVQIVEELETKVHQAIDTIALLQMEIEELKEKNDILCHKIQALSKNNETLECKNQQLTTDQQIWQDRLNKLLDKIQKFDLTCLK